MSKKTIKAWAKVQDGHKMNVVFDLYSTKKHATDGAGNASRFDNKPWRVIPCTITLSPKPAKGTR